MVVYLQSINNSVYDRHYHITKRRIIRAIEVVLSNNNNKERNINFKINNPLILGLEIDREELLMNIKQRLEKRIELGMIDEVKSLINNGMDLHRLTYFGLEYKFVGQYLFDEIKYDDMIIKLNYAINKFSKRQMTFFRRMEKRGIKILWISKNNYNQVEQYMEKYLENEL